MQELENLLAETEIHCWGKTPEEEYYKQQGIRASHSFYTSPRGLSLFTRSWLPSSSTPPRGILFMVHGYGSDISWSFQVTAIYFAQMGFACFGIDIEGHGRSQGLKAYVPNVDLVVQDCYFFFNSIKQDLQFHGLPVFLYGESMGGAICLLLHLANPTDYDGAILVAPMCKISEKLRPRWPIVEILTIIAKIFPTWAIVPTEDVLSKSIKVEEKKPIGKMNPLRYKGKPRLGTVLELLRVTEFLSQRLCDVSIPFLILHGSDDLVTEPNVSKALCEEAKSNDKTIKIYEGMMHSLLFGETDENIQIVRSDILSWLNERC